MVVNSNNTDGPDDEKMKSEECKIVNEDNGDKTTITGKSQTSIQKKIFFSKAVQMEVDFTHLHSINSKKLHDAKRAPSTSRKIGNTVKRLQSAKKAKNVKVQNQVDNFNEDMQKVPSILTKDNKKIMKRRR